MRLSTALYTVSGLLSLALADVSASSNIAVYWGQNSYGKASGGLEQKRLSYYCANTDVNIIPLSFLVQIGKPELNLANAGDNCTEVSGSTLFSCPQLEEDIEECQSEHGKIILLSIGGATYTEGGFTSSSDAVTAANNIWEIFGPEGSNSSVVRPFGKSVIDGFDFDFESTAQNMPAFGNELRKLMDADTSKKYYLSAAPQCPYPDAADGEMLDGGVSFDFVWVQFYNNYCGVQSFVSGSDTQSSFNFETWDDWAKNTSLNKDVKVFVGIPANTGAAGTGYISGSALSDVITYSKTFSSFGGVMMWDMSQLWANDGFLDAVSADLGGSAATKRSPSARLRRGRRAAA